MLSVTVKRKWSTIKYTIKGHSRQTVFGHTVLR